MTLRRGVRRASVEVRRYPNRVPARRGFQARAPGGTVAQTADDTEGALVRDTRPSSPTDGTRIFVDPELEGLLAEVAQATGRTPNVRDPDPFRQRVRAGSRRARCGSRRAPVHRQAPRRAWCPRGARRGARLLDSRHGRRPAGTRARRRLLSRPSRTALPLRLGLRPQPAPRPARSHREWARPSWSATSPACWGLRCTA